MTKYFPRLLLVTEADLNQHQEALGVTRTLLNLFDGYPKDKLFVYTTSDRSEKNTKERNKLLFVQSAFSSYEYIPKLRNRFGKYINQYIQNLNLQLIDWLNIPHHEKIEVFSPELILICPITAIGLLMGYKLVKYYKLPYMIYFMDNWVAKNNNRWLSGNLQLVTYKLLKESSGWLTISEYLEADLSQQYQLTPKKSLVISNSINTFGNEYPNEPYHLGGTFKIIYAGSIWGMHFDALAIVAEAIYQLQYEGQKIELVIYTKQEFWDRYKEVLERFNVKYGSFIVPYSELYRYLKQSNLLLVTCSFLSEYVHVIRSSLLSKLTEYMATGVPILSCGPKYSACNRFLKKWDCALVCETNQVDGVKKFLFEHIHDRRKLECLALRAFEVFQQNFEKKQVENKLYSFFESITYS